MSLKTSPSKVEIIEKNKVEEMPHDSRETSGNHSNWSKRNYYNPRPDYDYSRFKKSKWEWLGEFIGIGIFAFVCNYLIKACLVFLLCLISVPINAQFRYRKPNIRTTPSLSPKVLKEIVTKGQQLEEARKQVEKHEQLLQGRKLRIKSFPHPRKTTIKDFDLPLPLVPQDLRKGKLLYDSALYYITSYDTLNYIAYIMGSASVQYPKALYCYGVSLIDGVGLKQNIARGLFYINRSSELGCLEASLTIADCYYYGKYGYKRDSIMALNYFEKSATQGSLIGKVASGTIYFDRGEHSRAFDCWKSACEQAKTEKLDEDVKEHIAQLAYYLGYYSSLNPEKEVETINYFKTSAELGHPDGQAMYGDYCMQGYGMERDSAQAVCWYKQAALQNHVGAMQVLPFYYYDAHENDSTILWGTKPECRDSADIQYIVGAAYYVKEDYENAEVWWKKAASQNQLDAILWLYIHYDDNKKDSLTAFQYLRQAADLEQPKALCDMGFYYLNGYIVSKDISKAIDYYERSARLGCTEAYNHLGSIYYWNKYGVENRQRAASYWKQGAEAGNPECQYNYGCVLKKGQGVKKDKHQAIHWFTLSAQNGNEDAQEELKKMGITYETMR